MPDDDLKQALAYARNSDTPAALGKLAAAYLLCDIPPDSHLPKIDEEEEECPPSSYTRATPTPPSPRSIAG